VNIHAGTHREQGHKRSIYGNLSRQLGVRTVLIRCLLQSIASAAFLAAGGTRAAPAMGGGWLLPVKLTRQRVSSKSNFATQALQQGGSSSIWRTFRLRPGIVSRGRGPIYARLAGRIYTARRGILANRLRRLVGTRVLSVYMSTSSTCKDSHVPSDAMSIPRPANIKQSKGCGMDTALISMRYIP
jgi:hypothetical protein